MGATAPTPSKCRLSPSIVMPMWRETRSGDARPAAPTAMELPAAAAAVAPSVLASKGDGSGSSPGGGGAVRRGSRMISTMELDAIWTCGCAAGVLARRRTDSVGTE